MLRLSIAVAALVALLGLAACGGDDPEDGGSAARAIAAGDVERYCALTKRLDAAGEEDFRVLEEQDASPEEFQAAERRFIERHARELEELRGVAPARLKPDVDTLLAAMRQRAGLKAPTEVGESKASAAEGRIQAFEERECA